MILTDDEKIALIEPVLEYTKKVNQAQVDHIYDVYQRVIDPTYVRCSKCPSAIRSAYQALETTHKRLVENKNKQ